MSKLLGELQLDPSSLKFVELASLLLKQDSLAQGLAVCRAGLTYHEGHSSGRMVLARLLHRKGESEEALQVLEGLVEENPQLLGAWRLLEGIYRNLGDLRRAQECAEHVKLGRESVSTSVGLDKHFQTKAMAFVLRKQGKERRASQLEEQLGLESEDECGS